MADDVADVVLVVEYMPEGFDHWLVMRGAPGESLEDVTAYLRREWPGPVLVRERTQ